MNSTSVQRGEPVEKQIAANEGKDLFISISDPQKQKNSMKMLPLKMFASADRDHCDGSSSVGKKNRHVISSLSPKKIYIYVEASETRGTTALVYCLISSSLYTGTVQGWWSTPPTGLTVSRGVASSPHISLYINM